MEISLSSLEANISSWVSVSLVLSESHYQCFLFSIVIPQPSFMATWAQGFQFRWTTAQLHGNMGSGCRRGVQSVGERWCIAILASLTCDWLKRSVTTCLYHLQNGSGVIITQGSKLRGAEGQNAPKLSPNAPRLMNIGAKFCYPIQPDICFEA